MVRAGVVQHPGQWVYGRYRENQLPKQRYTLIDRQKLTALLGIKDTDPLKEYHRKWVYGKINSQILGVAAPAWQGVKAQEYQTYSELSQRGQAGCIIN